MRALPALVAVLLTLSSVVGATAVATPTPRPETRDSLASPVERPQTERPPTDTVHVLDIPAGSVTRTSVQSHHVDLGPSLTFAANRSHNRLQTLAVVERIESADTAAERSRRIRQAFARTEARIASLRDAQRAAIAAYGDGDLSPRELLIRLAKIDHTARALDSRRQRIESLASSADVDLDPGRLRSLELALQAFTGPVRAHAAAVIRGEAEPTRFYVASGPESVVLSAVVGDAYVREAYRGEFRSADAGSIDYERAVQIAADSYPVIWNLTRSSTQVVGSGRTYYVRVTHERGELAAFVDPATQSVFREFQRRPLGTVALRPGATNTKDGLRVTVNATYPGGPARVRLVDAATGDPVDANVTVGPAEQNSDLVGRTGEDGDLWMLTPGSEFTVTAIRGNSVVLVTVSPGDRPRVHPTNATG
ncbi:MAG: hypothetical protein ABEJ78_06955 [Haloferacaceae archaeon]